MKLIESDKLDPGWVSKSLYLKKTKFGRGVFCSKKIVEGQIIEICPVIPLSIKHGRIVQTTFLEDYVFQWPTEKQIKAKASEEMWATCCVTLGYGSLYNHSRTPNSEWTINYKKLQMIFYALETIKADTEIKHNYEWPDWKDEEVGIK